MSNERNIPVTPREFIERETQLPPDFGITPPDQAYAGQAEKAARSAPLGEPFMDYGVRSIYDSRPVNAFDFNIIASVSAEGPIAAQNIPISFVVPQGLVCVLRRIRTFIEPPPAEYVRRDDVLATLIRNGVDIQYNQNIPVGGSQDDLLNYFLIADENESVGVKLAVDAAAAVVTVTFYAHFYGNFLAKSGIPAQFEIANPGTGPVKIVTPRAQPIPVQNAPAQIPASAVAPVIIQPAAPRFRTKFAAAKHGR